MILPNSGVAKKKLVAVISVSENSIDSNLSMVDKTGSRQLSPFPATGKVRMGNTRNCA